MTAFCLFLLALGHMANVYVLWRMRERLRRLERDCDTVYVELRFRDNHLSARLSRLEKDREDIAKLLEGTSL